MKDKTAVNGGTQLADPPVADEAPVTDAPAASAEEASQQAAAAEVVVATSTAEIDDLRSQLETANKKRIPDLQREIAKAQQERDKAVATAQAFRSSMLEWTRKEMISAGLEDRWKEIDQREQDRTGRVLQTEAQRAETMEIINELLDTDDADSRSFARFLKAQVKAGQQVGTPVRVNRENVDTFREAYNEARGAGAPAAPSATTPAPRSAPAAAAAPAAKPPVRTVTPAAPPQGNPDEPVYAKTKGSARAMFGLAFGRKDDASG